MEWQYSLYVVLAPLTVMLAMNMLWQARRYRGTSASDTAALQGLVICLVGWVALDTLELLAPTEAGTLFWAQASYAFICATPVAWLAFALDYTGHRDWLSPARVAAYCAVPAVTVLLALTNPSHRLIWRTVEFVDTGTFLAMRVIHYGPAFQVYAAYGYALVAAGGLLIVRHSFAAFPLYRRQARLMAGGAVVPIVFNLAYVFHLIPGLYKDYTPVSFGLASMIFGIAMVRYRLLEVKPIARDVVIDTLQDPVLTLDTSGRLVDLNRAAVALIGPTAPQRAATNDDAVAQQLIGRPIEQALAGWPELAQTLPVHGERHLSLTFDTGAGRRYYDCHTLPLTDPRGRPAGEVVVLHEVTDYTQAEAELRRYAEALEAQNRELNAFAGTVAHDLKNPLAVIQAYTEMLADDRGELSPHDVHTFLRSISDCTEWMAHIVNELLLLARVRQTSDVPQSCLDMQGIVEQAVAQLERLICGSRARVTVATCWPEVMGHAPWVSEVWINYLSNALKYGGRSDLDLPPQVEMGFDPDHGAAQVRFWVRDQGPGIKPEQQARLFVEFSRLPATERTLSGHGLGLSIVQRIVHKLGGEVGVDSRPGEGSSFWFTLPRAPVTAPRPASPGTPPPPP